MNLYKSILFITLLSISSQVKAAEQLQDSSTIIISAARDSVVLQGRYGDKKLSVTIPDNPNERLKSFNKSAKEIGLKGEFVSCHALIDIPGGQNHSYGGYCTLVQDKKKLALQVCNDDMVGHFAIYHSQDNLLMQDRATLINFVVSNCFGG